MDMQIGKRAPITRSALPDRLFGFSKRKRARRMKNSKPDEGNRTNRYRKRIYIHTYTYTYIHTYTPTHTYIFDINIYDAYM